MNDRRFIELLNLYVDQELTDDEARALEQEIAQSPERREVYTQYCRMQRACVRLFEQQAAPAPQIDRLAAAALMAGRSETIEFPSVPVDVPVQRAGTQRWGRIAWAGGMMAAAACVALVALRQPEVAGTTPSLATTSEVVQPTQAIAAAPVAAPASQGADYQPVVLVNTLLRSESQTEERGAAHMAALDPSSLEWAQEMKLLPMRRVPFETLRFDAQGRFETIDQATFAADRAEPSTATEISAFQFQR